MEQLTLTANTNYSAMIEVALMITVEFKLFAFHYFYIFPVEAMFCGRI